MGIRSLDRNSITSWPGLSASLPTPPNSWRAAHPWCWPIGFVRQSLASDFEPVILTLPQVLDIFDNLDLMRRTMALTDAATALRVSEILALMWKDLDFVAQLI